MNAPPADAPYDGARSRVLFLSQDMPWPSIGGGRTRCITLLLHALEVVKVDLIVVAPRADVERDSWAIPELPGLTTHVFANEAETRVDQLLARQSPAAKQLAREMAVEYGGYDAVHLEGHFLWPIVPEELHSRTVVVEYNIESLLLGQRMDLGDAVTAEDVDGYRSSEQDVWRRAVAMITLCPEDGREIQRREPGVVPHFVPLGWDHLPTRSTSPSDSGGRLIAPRLLFFADYDYLANRDAFDWLLADVFPRVRAAVPGAELVIGGINMTPDPDEAVYACPGATARGFIDDLAAELDRADIVLCPLRWGGGVKVKVIESIRRSCLLVSTTTGGTDGIPEPLRSAVCFADDGEGFAGHIIRLCDDPVERHWRRALLTENQHVVPTWESSSLRTMRLWADVSKRADEIERGGPIAPPA